MRIRHLIFYCLTKYLIEGSEVSRDLGDVVPFLHAHLIGEACRDAIAPAGSRVTSLPDCSDKK